MEGLAASLGGWQEAHLPKDKDGLTRGNLLRVEWSGLRRLMWPKEKTEGTGSIARLFVDEPPVEVEGEKRRAAGESCS